MKTRVNSSSSKIGRIAGKLNYREDEDIEYSRRASVRLYIRFVPSPIICQSAAEPLGRQGKVQRLRTLR